MGNDTRKTRKLMLSIAVVLTTCTWNLLAQEPSDENLMISLPDGWVLAWSGEGEHLFDEYVPEGQSVEEWQDLLTIQIFYGGLGMTPNEMAAESRRRWQNACPGSSVYKERSEIEYGYPIAFWQQFCDLMPSSGQPEHTILKAIQGTDHLYLIQRAWRELPGDEEIVAWSQYLAGIYVCNSRIPGRECP